MDQIFVRDIVEAVEKWAPRDLAEEWDHIGLMIGDINEPVYSVVLALDMTPASIEHCLKTGSNLLITHHPCFYAPCRCIDFGTPKGRLIRDALNNGIHVYAAHTNLDRAVGGVNDALAERLNLSVTSRIEIPGIGLITQTQNAESYLEFAEKVKDKLDAAGLFMSSREDAPIKSVAVCGGSFLEESIDAIHAANVDLVLTGEIKHHHMIDLKMRGIRVIAAGHGATEQTVMPVLDKYLKQQFKDLQVYVVPNYC